MPLPKPTMFMQAMGQLVRPIFNTDSHPADAKAGVRHIQFNTGRPYTEDGQIIEAIHDNIVWTDGERDTPVPDTLRNQWMQNKFGDQYTEVRFYDHCRNIGGTIIVWDLEHVSSDMALREFVMHSYLHNQFTEDCWSVEGLHHYEMQNRIQKSHAGSTPATPPKVREVPNDTPWWRTA